MNHLYLHWVCVCPPTCEHLKVGLSTDIEKRKKSYYSDGWKGDSLGFLSIREIPENYDLEVLELALQIYFFLKSGQSLYNTSSRDSLEIFPYYNGVEEDFNNLSIPKVFSNIGETVFKALGKDARLDWGIKRKIKTRLYENTKESILKSLLLEMGEQDWDEELLYELWPIAEIECNLVYREILCWGIGSGKLQKVGNKIRKM